MQARKKADRQAGRREGGRGALFGIALGIWPPPAFKKQSEFLKVLCPGLLQPIQGATQHTCAHSFTKADTRIDRQTGGEAERQIDRQTGRQAGRETDESQVKSSQVKSSK